MIIWLAQMNFLGVTQKSTSDAVVIKRRMEMVKDALR